MRWSSRAPVSPRTGTPMMLSGARSRRSSNTPSTLTSPVRRAASIRRSALAVAPTTTMLGVRRPSWRPRAMIVHQAACSAVTDQRWRRQGPSAGASKRPKASSVAAAGKAKPSARATRAQVARQVLFAWKGVGAQHPQGDQGGQRPTGRRPAGGPRPSGPGNAGGDQDVDDAEGARQEPSLEARPRRDQLPGPERSAPRPSRIDRFRAPETRPPISDPTKAAVDSAVEAEEGSGTHGARSLRKPCST
jgi:hypothetical protein